MPEPEVAESGFSPDGTEVALFPDAVQPATRSGDTGAERAASEQPDSKMTGILIGLGVAAVVFGIAFVAFGRRGKTTDGLPAPSGESDFRG